MLLNEYQPGQGIDAHRDGPLYAPRVAILSLCSHCAFEFLRNDAARDAVCSLLLPPRGVLVFSDDAYHELLHTVPAVAADDAPPPPGVERIDLRAGAARPPPLAHGAPRARAQPEVGAAARALGAQRRRRALRRRARVRGARVAREREGATGGVAGIETYEK